MKSFFLAAEAFREAEEAATYYESQQQGLGKRFLGALKDSIQRAASNPLFYAIAKAPARKCRVRRFPYAVIYLDTKDRVEIIAVAHLHREPFYWANRISQN